MFNFFFFSFEMHFFSLLVVQFFDRWRMTTIREQVPSHMFQRICFNRRLSPPSPSHANRTTSFGSKRKVFDPAEYTRNVNDMTPPPYDPPRPVCLLRCTVEFRRITKAVKDYLDTWRNGWCDFTRHSTFHSALVATDFNIWLPNSSFGVPFCLCIVLRIFLFLQTNYLYTKKYICNSLLMFALNLSCFHIYFAWQTLNIINVMQNIIITFWWENSITVLFIFIQTCKCVTI